MKQTNHLAIVFLMMAFVLMTSVGVMYWMGWQALQGTEAVVTERLIISSLNQTLGSVKDAETGQRGFLLTGDPAYLAPYDRARVELDPKLQKLADEAKIGELSTSDVADITAIAHRKMAELAQTVALFQQGQRDSAIAIMRQGDGKRSMDALRQRIGSLVAAEEGQLEFNRQRSRRLTAARNALFAAVACINLGFMYWCFTRVSAEIAGRTAAAAEVTRQKELLAVTLASIGDAVIVTDLNGRITFINEVAAELCGWSTGDALGKPCSTVFNIISEQSRQPAESPVDKVLKLGIVVGLANHTLLIRRDGTELPIDDSGAPVRGNDGRARGVVLVFRDFSEHKRAENTLRAAKADLEAASRAKDQFLATLSHELRTPLTPVLATLTAWEASDELPEAFREDAQMLRRNIALEARLIDDLLDLTRIVRGKFPLEVEVVDVHELLLSVSGMYRSEIHFKRVDLTLDLAATRHHASVDPGRMQQVFWNILKNATKFTPEYGKIQIQSRDLPSGEIELTFRDSGIGMSQATLDRLFLPFEQGAEEVVRRAGGLGLGMAISKALVEVQKGRISATSEGSGKGSTFVVSLASVEAPANAVPFNIDREHKSRPKSRALSILLVEDHADTARVMGRLLRRLGHSVELSDTVAGALTLARSKEYDILLSDIGLPDGTGLELMKQIRVIRDMPAVALTGFGMDDDIARCHEAGFTAHLTKPVNFQRLEMVIQQVATRSE